MANYGPMSGAPPIPPEEILRDVFGFSAFRGCQEVCVQAEPHALTLDSQLLSL